MNGQNHTPTMRRTTARTGFAFALAAACMMALPALLHAQRKAVNKITVVLTADQSVIQQAVDAAKQQGVPTSPGGAVNIPVNVIKALALNALLEKIGSWLRNKQMCELFDQWAAGKNVGATGTITIEFILVPPGEAPTPASPRITVNFFAKKTGQGTATAGNSGSTGYIAPIGPGGSPTMKLDLFGDGSYVLERMDCPRR